MICVIIARTRHKMALIEIKEAAKRGAQMIEVRLDYLAKAPDFKRLLAEKPCPLVATVRRPEDGGRWAGTEEARQMLLRQAVVSGFDWVDLETDLADSIRRFKNVKRIVSYHNREEVPADLEKIHQRMCAQDPDVVKIVVTPQQPADNLRVLELLKKTPKPTIAFCMDEIGFPTRVLGGKFGAPFTYASFNPERSLAPGLPTFDELRRVYHYDLIDGNTEVFGLIGDPVGHSLSPLIHNVGFTKLGINAVYLPFRVPGEALPSFIQAFEKLPVRGYSVTIPHKEAAMMGATKRDPAASLVQAANTLVRGPEGFTAYNTDLQAARDSLLAHLAIGGEGAAAKLKGKTVLILGAGGVARAIAHALDQEGAAITITNRTPSRAQKLAEEIDCRYVEWGGRLQVLCEILINCTSVGMYPKMDVMPIHSSFLKAGLVVFDTVYNPETTLLVKEARARGCHVLPGTDMFVRQAILQFELFTGRRPPEELMLQVVKQALSPVKIREEE